MGRLIPFCLTATEDSSSLYGVAYGYNTSDPTVGQLVILVKADVSAPTPISLSSLTWSLVGLIQRNKVMTAPDNSQFISACAVSSGGVFTFLSPNVVPLNMTSSTSTATGGVPGGFRYDPTITAGLPNPLTPPSTANCNSQSWNNLWRFISVDPNVGWNSTATQANTYASLFYVPKAANSNGFGSTENLVLSHLKDGTVYFAQEDNAFLLHHTGTLRTPTAYISSITTYTNYAGNFYLVGPTTTSPANMTTVLGIPIVDGYLSALPTSLKVYNSAPGSIPVGFTGGCASSQNTVLATVTLNSLFYFCLSLVGPSHTLFSIPNVLSDSLISAPTSISISARSSAIYSAVHNLVSFSSPATATDRHPYGVLFGRNGVFGLGLDPSDTSVMNEAQTFSVSGPAGTVLTNSQSGDGGGGGDGSGGSGGGGSSGGSNGDGSSGSGRVSLPVIVGAVVAVVVVVLAVAVFFYRRSKAKKKSPQVDGPSGEDIIIPELKSSAPLPQISRSPHQQPSYYSQPQKLHFQGQEELQQGWIPEPLSHSPHSPMTNADTYTPTPFQPPSALFTVDRSPAVDDSSPPYQEAFARQLQLSNHPRPNVVRIVTSNNQHSNNAPHSNLD